MTAPKRHHGKTREEWERMCLSKARYASEAVARIVGQRALSQPQNDTARLFVYRCQNCRGWHLTRSAHLNPDVPAVTRSDLFLDRRRVL